MTRGRKPKHPDQQWLKDLSRESMTPEREAKLQEQRDMCKRGSNLWRQLRKMGVSIDYFEMQEITDPELMGDKALSYEEAAKKYAPALEAIDEARERTSTAQRKGAVATKEKSAALRNFIAENFPDVVNHVRKKTWTVNDAAGKVIKRLEALQTEGKYDGGIPEMTAAREHLKYLSLATP